MPDGKLRVAFITPEAAPFAKSGELADVTGSLPKILASLGAEVSLFLPKYRLPEIDSLSKELVASNLSVPLGTRKIKASVYRAEPGKYTVYFIDNPKYFLREHIYGPSTGAYLDNDERFIFFNRAVLEFMLKSGFKTDIIHSHNWPAALIPVFLKTHYVRKPLFKETTSILTLHNVAYQGEFPADSLALAGLTWNGFASLKIDFDGKFNFLKAGVIFADAVNTVSRTYRKEILSGKQAPGLAALIKSRNLVLETVRNGIDTEEWDPRTDPYIAENFDPENIGGKRACRGDLVREFGLDVSEKTPILGIVSYLTRNKGFDLLLDSVLRLMAMDIGLIVLGRGDDSVEEKFRTIQERYPGKAAVRIEMNPALSHKIIAGSDLLLMPSFIEPCGLTQLYAFRYGTVPVVRATGGLRETVIPFDSCPEGGNVFVFNRYRPGALLTSVGEALVRFREPEMWSRIMAAGFRQDFSWESSAREYLDLYLKNHIARRGGNHVR
jgi:starch synthase